MRYLLYDEAVQLGIKPYAVYGGKVYSVSVPATETATAGVIPHGTTTYAEWIAQADALKASPTPSQDREA